MEERQANKIWVILEEHGAHNPAPPIGGAPPLCTPLYLGLCTPRTIHKILVKPGGNNYNSFHIFLLYKATILEKELCKYKLL